MLVHVEQHQAGLVAKAIHIPLGACGHIDIAICHIGDQAIVKTHQTIVCEPLTLRLSGISDMIGHFRRLARSTGLHGHQVARGPVDGDVGIAVFVDAHVESHDPIVD